MLRTALLVEAGWQNLYDSFYLFIVYLSSDTNMKSNYIQKELKGK